jgi:hypothetical protein
MCREFAFQQFLAYLFIVFLAIIIFIQVAILFYDIVINFKKLLSKYCFCRFVCLFWRDDPFYYRIEIYIYVLISFYLIVSQVLIFILTTVLVLPDIVVALSKSIFTYLLALNIIIFPLTITIFNIFRTCLLRIANKNNKTEIIDVLLGNEKTLDLFREFAKREWSVENVLIYTEIKEFENTKDFGKKQLIAISIKETYLEKNSPMELNIDDYKLKNFTKMLEEGKVDGIFNDILKTVKINLADTYSRFRFSNEYLIFQRNQSLIKGETVSSKVELKE